MGYELTIVRQNDYSDGEERSNISLSEWLNYVDTDKELILTNGYESAIPGQDPIWEESIGFCYWLGHPNKQIDYRPWFDYGTGCIYAKYPDSDTIKKMITISLALNAKVRGDDFEYYDETYFTNEHRPISTLWTPANEEKPIDSNTKKPWWKFW
jgi:hypothetical protein